MTTDSEAAKIAPGLTLVEIKSLKQVQSGEEPDYMTWFALKEKGLVSWSSDHKMTLTSNGRNVLEYLATRETAATAEGSAADEAQTFAELCEREIVKIRSLTLHDDEYTGDLLAYAVGSPVGITMCVEARMKQIADLQAEVENLKKQVKKLKRKSNLDDGFIDHLTQEKGE